MLRQHYREKNSYCHISNARSGRKASCPARDKLTINGTTYIILVSREKKSFTSLRYYEVFFQ